MECTHTSVRARCLLARCFLVLALAIPYASGAPAPRNVKVSGRQFILSATNEPIVLSGPNVVVKGPPYLPSVSGDTFCNDIVDSNCTAHGDCKTCFTFNEADVKHIKAMGWNAIRLGVVWAGAQPTEGASLDPDFLERLHAVLSLCDRTGIHVMLDNHGDMVGTAGCGNGVPMWVQQKAAPELIGKPLTTSFPYDLVPSLRITKAGGYAHCGDNQTKWAAHAGDPNYNLLNECCQAMNSGGNPAAIGYTSISQKTMAYVMSQGDGRDAFVQYWKLMADAVAEHPSAYAFELMNEPMSIHRRDMFDSWKAVAVQVNQVIPDMSIAISDTGQGAALPAWLSKIAGAGVVIDSATVDWIKQSTNLFYAWHWYGEPKTPQDAIANVQEISNQWDVPSFLSESMSCAAWNAAKAANISHTYWHYSSYCSTGSAFGNRKVPDDSFGACILGWGAGHSDFHC